MSGYTPPAVDLTATDAAIATVDGVVDSIEAKQPRVVVIETGGTSTTSGITLFDQAVDLPAGSWYMVCYATLRGSVVDDVGYLQFSANGVLISSCFCPILTLPGGFSYSMGAGPIVDGQKAKLYMGRQTGSGTITCDGAIVIAYPVAV